MTPTRLSPDFSMGLNVQDKLRTLTEKFIETIEYRDIDNNQNRDEKAVRKSIYKKTIISKLYNQTFQITKLNQNDPQTGSPASILPYISSNKNILDPDMIHPEDEFEPSIDLSHEPNMIFTAVLDRLTPPSILEDRAKDNEEMNSILRFIFFIFII